MMAIGRARPAAHDMSPREAEGQTSRPNKVMEPRAASGVVRPGAAGNVLRERRCGSPRLITRTLCGPALPYNAVRP